MRAKNTESSFSCIGCKHGGKPSDMYPCRKCINGNMKEPYKMTARERYAKYGISLHFLDRMSPLKSVSGILSERPTWLCDKTKGDCCK